MFARRFAVRALVPLILTSSALIVATSPISSAQGRSAVAHLARSCSLHGREQSLGPTYVTRVSVSGVSCHDAYGLVHAYYRCRVHHGGVTGHCGGVDGFRCSEHRYAKIPTQYEASVTCTRGREAVKHNYTQFT